MTGSHKYIVEKYCKHERSTLLAVPFTQLLCLISCGQAEARWLERDLVCFGSVVVSFRTVHFGLASYSCSVLSQTYKKYAIILINKHKN